jgi:hypothetical protein
MRKCRLCPWPWNDRLPCLSIVTTHTRYCDVSNPNHPEFGQEWRDWMRSDDGRRRRDEEIALRLRTETSRVEHDENLRRAETCPHRSIEGCGCCGGAICLPGGKRPGDRVTILDCLACVRANS